MTIVEIRFQVEQIQTMAGRDDEKAHGMEDALWQDVLRAIAKGSRKSRVLAREALKTLQIKFPRHCS
jgi:hypothetical protein